MRIDSPNLVGSTVITGSAVVTGSVVPGSDLLYDFGSTLKRWGNIYAVNLSGSFTGSNVSFGQVIVAGAGGVLSGTNNLFWDNTSTRLGIGTSSLTSTLTVSGSATATIPVLTLRQGAVTPGAASLDVQNRLGVSTFWVSGSGASFFSGSVGIGTSVFSAALFVSGGTAPSNSTLVVREGVTNALGGAEVLDVQRSTGSSLFWVSGSGDSYFSGSVGIGATQPAGKLDVSGVSGSLLLITDTMSGSLFSVNNVSGLPIFEIFSNNRIVAGGFNTNALVLTGSNVGIGATTPGGKIDVSGVSGSLFLVTDSMSGSLFSVNNVSGLPILEVFSDSRVVAGGYNANALVVSGSRVAVGTNPTNTIGLLVSGSSTASDQVLVVKSGASSPSSAYFDVQSNTGASHLSVLGTGFVGIGTNNPGFRLQLGNNTSTSTATPETINLGGSYSNTAGSNLKIRTYWDGTNAAGLGHSVNQLDYSIFTGGSHVWYVGGTERVRINSSGNVGIGTTNPQHRIQLGGLTSTSTATPDTINLGATFSNTAGSNLKLRTYWDGTNAAGLGHSAFQLDYSIFTGGSHVWYIAGTEYLRLNSTVFGVSSSLQPGTDNLYDLGTSSKRWRGIYAANISGFLTGSGLTAGSVVYVGPSGALTQNNTNFFWDNANTRLHLGSAIPASGQKFNVFESGNSRTGMGVITGVARSYTASDAVYTIGHVSVTDGTTYTERLRIDTSGNVGIATNNPGYKLTIAGGPPGGQAVFAVDNTAYFVAKNAAGTYEDYFWPRWSDNIMYLNYGSAGWNIRNSSSTSTMFMTNGGNVGIGTTNPQHRLQIGSQTSTSTATPDVLSLGGTFSSTPGSNIKLRVWTDGSTMFGLGVSTGQLDYSVTTGASHVWYIAGTEYLRLNSTVLAVSSSLQPGTDNARSLGSSSKRWSTVHATALSGSLTKLSTGEDYLVAGPNIQLTTGSNGQVTITGTSSGTVAGSGTAGLVTRWTGTSSLGTGVIYDDGTNVGVGTTPGGDKLAVNGSMSVTGSLLPGADVSYSLGSEQNRWQNIYTGDLHLKNERGDWTLIEEDDCLTMRNNKTGKRYKILMERMPELDEPLGGFSTGPKPAP